MPTLPNDNEFTDSTVTEGQFKSNLTRMTGFLRGLLGVSGLASEARIVLGLGNQPINYLQRGAWVTATQYNVNDLVTNAGITYVCQVGHVSGTFATDQSAGKWNVHQGMTREELMTSDGSSLIGWIQLGVGAVFRWISDKLRESVSVKDFGAASDGITNDAAAVVKANTAAGQRPLLFVGITHIATATTITAPIADTMAQIFSITSQVTINNGQPVRPEWFGSTAGNIRRAVDSLPAKGGVVQLADATYPPSYDSATGVMFNNRGGTPGVDYMIKPHVFIRGTRLPEYAADNSCLQNGTIIQGTFYVASEATGFQADRFGVDAGINVITALYGGADHDCFCYLQANKAAPVYGTNVHIGKVRGLCSGDTSQAHAVLLEAIDGGTVEFAEGRCANHGVVIKSKNIVANTLAGSLNHGEDVILKSDSYAGLSNVCVANVACAGKLAGDAGYGLLILASAAGGGAVQIGNVLVERKSCGVGLLAQGQVLGDINIANIITQSCPTGYSIDGGVVRAVVGNALINNSTTSVLVGAGTVDMANAIAQLSVNVCTYGADISGKLRIGGASFSGVTGFSVYHRTTSARVFIGGHVEAPGSVFWAGTPALINSWANFGPNDPFSVGIGNGKVVLSGLISSGTASQIAMLYDAVRPIYPLRFACVAYTGSSYYTAEVLVLPTGAVYVSNYTAGASAYLSLQGVSWPIPF